MALTDQLAWRLQRHPKRIVFPEGSDPRILQAARLFAAKNLGVPILLGDRLQIKQYAEQLHIRLDGIRIIEPGRSTDLDTFVERLREAEAYQHLPESEARDKVLEPNVFGALMLRHAQADAMVSGATEVDSSAMRPVFNLIPPQRELGTISSMLILDMDYPKLGVDGVLFLADCGVIVEPTVEQLAEIAVTTASIGHHLTNAMPRVAMLSYTTHSKEADHPSILRIRESTHLAREKAAQTGIEMEIDGEMQVDAALVQKSAEYKKVTGSVAGQANVLIFPDLNCGSVASKLLSIVADARSYGQIVTGLTKPFAEISRGASAHDIFGAAVIVACQAVDHRLLYGREKRPDEA